MTTTNMNTNKKWKKRQKKYKRKEKRMNELNECVETNQPFNGRQLQNGEPNRVALGECDASQQQ